MPVPGGGGGVGLSAQELLITKREGGAWSAAQVHALVRGAVDGSLSRPQLAAALAFALCRGMSDAETVALTTEMVDSGRRLRWPVDPSRPVCDKHSTGGVGDKVSLVLAPLWASLGLRVPMLSGRGLGHTGGTLDKLEAVPGFRVDVNEAEAAACLEAAGCFISGQTAALAPADGVLYALRDETATVPSIPLITASILSKKAAAGVERLVMDVKYGSGAFMPTLGDARALAESLERVGAGLGMQVRCALTPMSTPLGRTIGNALEVREAVATLSGGGDPALRALTLRLTSTLDPQLAAAASSALDDGRALAAWRKMVRAQGGDPDAPLRGLDSAEVHSVSAMATGRLLRLDALPLGKAAVALGAGRAVAGEAVLPGVGLELLVDEGDSVVAGQPLLRLWHAGRGLDAALELVHSAVQIGAVATGPAVGTG